MNKTSYIFFFSIILLFCSSRVHAELKPLRVGITAVLIEQNISSNQQLARYIGNKLDLPVETVYRKSYREINEMLGRSEIDIAIVCGYAYVVGRKDYGIELVASPTINGRPFYRSYVIVPAASEDKDFFSMRGKRYAFTDPLSNSGYLVPVSWLTQKGENPDNFFKKYIFTRGHYNSIEAVAMRIVDGASVDGYVWEQAKKIEPRMVSMTKVVMESEEYPFTPVVARKKIDKDLKKRILNVLLSMNRDPEGINILRGIGIDGFIKVADDFYNPIRDMERKVKAGSETGRHDR